MIKVLCPYCDKNAVKTTGRAVYPHRTELRDKLFYRCAPCDAHVGCHPGTANPLGNLANSELRQARQAAHSAFDPYWRGGSMSRSAAYSWLAKQLGLPKDQCHIGMFDVATCNRVVVICTTEDFEVLR